MRFTLPAFLLLFYPPELLPEGSERDKLTREWQIYQDNYQKDQEIVFLKLKNLIQEEKISQLSQKNDPPKLSGGSNLEL
jgi:hypothetical protein